MNAAAGWVRAGLVAAVLLAGGCAGWPWSSLNASSDAAATPRPYWPDRRDYHAFRAAHRDIIEPNYLPFMVHRLPGDDPAGDHLVLCRWPNDAMPLRVFIDSPVIPEELQDEFDPVEPERYAEAAEAALQRWEKELEGLVTFRRVDERSDADLELILVAETAPVEADRRGLGRISLSNACRVHGEDPDSDRLVVMPLRKACPTSLGQRRRPPRLECSPHAASSRSRKSCRG